MDWKRICPGVPILESNPTLQALRDCESHIYIKRVSFKTGRPLSLAHIMLGPLTRQDVVRRMKDPLRFAIEEGGKRGKGIIHYWRTLRAIWRIFRVCQLYPKVTRENCLMPNTFILLDVRDWFFDHLQNMRIPMFQSVWDMFINLYEHAGEYTMVFDVLIEKLVEIYNSGKWERRRKDRLIPRFWKE